MDIGIFMPTANNGYIISNNVRFPPTYDLNREMTINAEEAGFDFVLSMVKLRGYGGATEHWDYCLESLVLMSALADEAACRRGEAALFGNAIEDDEVRELTRVHSVAILLGPTNFEVLISHCIDALISRRHDKRS